MTGYYDAMKTALFSLCAILICASSVVAQSWRLNRARLCFVREEDNGAMNTLQSWIRVADYDVPLIGGQAVCLYGKGNSLKESPARLQAPVLFRCFPATTSTS